MIWLIPPIMIAGTLIAVGRKKRVKNDSGDVIDIANTGSIDVDSLDNVGRVDVRALAESIGAPAPWVDFFDFTFWGESGHRADVGLGIQTGAPPWVDMNSSPAEAKASCKTYNSNLSWLQPCWPAVGYCFGSGGLGAMFPASALAAFRDDPVYRCAHPWSIFDPSAHIIYAAWFARRLQGWSNWTGTVLSMRIGWGNPSAMGKTPDPKKVAKWSKHCEARGINPDFLYTTLPAWTPAPARDLWLDLGIDNDWLKPMQEVA